MLTFCNCYHMDNSNTLYKIIIYVCALVCLCVYVCVKLYKPFTLSSIVNTGVITTFQSKISSSNLNYLKQPVVETTWIASEAYKSLSWGLERTIT